MNIKKSFQRAFTRVKGTGGVTTEDLLGCGLLDRVLELCIGLWLVRHRGLHLENKLIDHFMKFLVVMQNEML